MKSDSANNHKNEILSKIHLYFNKLYFKIVFLSYAIANSKKKTMFTLSVSVTVSI